MRNKMMRLVLPLAVSGLMGLGLSGCVAVVAGGAAVGTVAYIRGDSKAVVDADLESVRAVAKATMEDLGLVMINADADKTSAVFNSRNAQDTKIGVQLEVLTEKTTRISVRYGFFGNEEQSSRILTEIVNQL